MTVPANLPARVRKWTGPAVMGGSVLAVGTAAVMGGGINMGNDKVSISATNVVFVFSAGEHAIPFTAEEIEKICATLTTGEVPCTPTPSTSTPSPSSSLRY